jgi:hypothetical protein
MYTLFPHDLFFPVLVLSTFAAGRGRVFFKTYSALTSERYQISEMKQSCCGLLFLFQDEIAIAAPILIMQYFKLK